MSLLAVGIAVLVGIVVSGALVRPVRRVRHVLDALAAGDLTAEVEVTSRDEVGQMAAALATAGVSLRTTVAAIAGSATALADAAGTLSDSSRAISAQVTGSADRAGVVAEAAHSASTSITDVSAGPLR
ncbi:HAMP domain-containing protein [Dactylosporangium sp. McL0621]|uniref:HAMP domain-containing protein n=1 Tax=Dactylosporangium sp. McL0621 TaxID=3415678 RepID=UPI003CEB9D6D